MMALPKAPDTVVAPGYFSPSTLDYPSPCGLKVLALAEPNRASFATIRPSPHAALGSVFHKAIELFSTGQITDAVEWFEGRLDADAGDDARYPTLRAAV